MSLVDPECEGAVIDQMFDALSRGDFDAARDCLTAGARVWHSYDQVPHDRDGIMAWWQGLANFSERQSWMCAASSWQMASCSST